MEHGGESGKLDIAGRAGRASFEKRAVTLEQPAKLLAFDGDLLAELIPHAAVPLPLSGSA